MKIYKYKTNENIYLNHNDYDGDFYLIFPFLDKINNTYKFNIISWDKYDNVNIYENITNYKDVIELSNEYYKKNYIFCKIKDIIKISNKIYDWYQKNNNQYYIKVDYNENDLDRIDYIIDFLRNQTILNYLKENNYNFNKLNFNNFHTENDLNENIKLNIPKNTKYFTNIISWIIGIIPKFIK